MEKSKNNAKKLSFANGVFVIKAPEALSDIVVEGSALHHCVKLYISRVTNGETNILFLRKREAPDVPFYTIEVDRCNVIQQVRGLSNCKATKEIYDFVKTWAGNKKLHMSAI